MPRPVRSVYPRVCGGTEHDPRRPACAEGLSPRVRGNRGLTNRVMRVCRSIPACAGEPQVGGQRRREIMVYPRVCGGTTYDATGVTPTDGLSPRVRGNRSGRYDVTEYARSIPACAGEPRSHFQNQAVPRVYPRVCGGTTTPAALRVKRRGLSPRVRGNPP